GIVGFAEILKDEMAEEGLDSFLPDLQKIQSSADHLIHLIGGILDLSKIEAGRMDLHLGEFDLEGLIGEVAASVQPLVEENRSTLELRLADPLGPVYANATNAKQVLLNRLSNAAKVTHA